MQYTEKTGSYNERRYGKPWMAIVTTSMTRDFTFLDWDGRPGSVGEFCFTADPGTLLAYGQKDIRKGRGGVDGYQIAMPDGTLPIISDSLAQDLRKMPTAKRPAEAARRIIAANEAKLAEYADKLADPFYVSKAAEANAAIERYRAFLPSSASAAVDMSGFGF